MNAAEMVKAYICKETSFTIDYHDLEALSQEVYGKEIEFIETPNDSTHEYNVKDKELEKWDKKYLEEAIKDGNLSASQYYIVLNDLCARKIIEPGKYYVRVCW